MGAFAEALDSIPMALAENSGLNPIETLASIKSRQFKEENPRLGVDCMQTGSNGMWPRSVFSVPEQLPWLNSLPRLIVWVSSDLGRCGMIDMRENFVIDPLIGKRQQLLLATQLCRMVLKVSPFFTYMKPPDMPPFHVPIICQLEGNFTLHR